MCKKKLDAQCREHLLRRLEFSRSR